MIHIHYHFIKYFEKFQSSQMTPIKNTFRLRALLLSTLVITLYGCDDFIQPTNHIIDYYVSPQAAIYQIKTVALFPMAKDDTTDTGTFYSTNHFINRLEQSFPNVKFFIPSIDSLIRKDSPLVPHLIKSIGSNNKLNVESFDSSEVGKLLADDNPDAMIVGLINNSSNRRGVGLVRNEFLNFEFRAITSCDFTYYLISLKDGSTIWKFRVVGEEVYGSNHINDDFPPLDTAISNGIDFLLDTRLPEQVSQ
ncbi:MAG: hypothetical protein M1495_21480 [Bacteroidetes bacterium]|nr:hypothetical protein [Bacteroidota bacterium]